MKKISITLPILFYFLYTAIALAQENSATLPMITDRPDATESPNVVPLHSLQLETGAFYTETSTGIEEKTYGYNTTLLRFGLLESLELRLGWDLAEIKTTDDVTLANGFSPLLAGAKIHIAEEKGLLPEIGFLGHLYLPFTASSDFKPETTGVDFRFSFSHTLSERSGLAYNLGAAWGNDSAEAAYEYTISYGYSITSKLGFYAELYGDFPENSSANHLWDAGFTYLVKNTVQLDATIGSGITESQDILASAGVSILLFHPSSL